MAFEFKKLSDVEVVAEPLETANVLIEEDGVIKKAPKTAVGGAGGAGGAGGGAGNLVFAFDSNDWVDSEVGYRQLFKSEGIYEALDQMWNNYSDLNVTFYRKSSDRIHIEVIDSILKSDDVFHIGFHYSGYYVEFHSDGRAYSNQYD